MTQDFEQARYSTHEKLVGRLEGLRQGKDVKSLESFAKAYLGMYLDLDKSLLPDERVRLLADDDILDSIWVGFEAILYSQPLSSPEDIGRMYASDQRMPQGYIALAAMDRQIRQSAVGLADMDIDEKVLESLICFQYVDRNELQNLWMDYAVQQRARQFSVALLRFWAAIQDAGVERYPGFREVLQKEAFQQVLQHLALPALQTIRRIHKKLLPALLLAAFKWVPHPDLLIACRQRLAEGGHMPVVQHVYWLSSAYLLAPQEFAEPLTDYIGRTREKAVPMLNFLELILKNNAVIGLTISPDILARLLTILAPKFRPVHDQFGRLDDNVAKIAWLFDLLGQDSSDQSRQAVRRLRKIRVMRLYSRFLDEVERKQRE